MKLDEVISSWPVELVYSDKSILQILVHLFRCTQRVFQCLSCLNQFLMLQLLLKGMKSKSV